MLRARGELRLGSVRIEQGHTKEALALIESGRRALLDLRSQGYNDTNLAEEINRSERDLAYARVSAGDLDGALNIYLELLRNAEPCDEQAPTGKACRDLSNLLQWTADVYTAPGRPNLAEPGEAAKLLEQAAHIQERVAALDPHDRGARFPLAGRLGRLGDAVWRSDPKRALALYERALGTARELVSKEQYQIIEDSYLVAISRPLMKLGRLAEARKALAELLRSAERDTTYADRLDDIPLRLNWVNLLLAEGHRNEARHSLEKLTRDVQDLHASRPGDLTPVYFLSMCYRTLASMTSGQERRDALLKSAAAWHSWPATSYTKREEQKDLAVAKK
jgi:tetratricopeptide (TPR) repeat protein